jgi:hypothetical protein
MRVELLLVMMEDTRHMEGGFKHRHLPLPNEG